MINKASAPWFAFLAFVVLLVVALGAQEPAPAPAAPVAPKVDTKTQAEVENLKAVIARMESRLRSLEPLIPADTPKQAQRRARASWKAICTDRGMAFDSLQVNQDGKSTVVCK